MMEKVANWWAPIIQPGSGPREWMNHRFIEPPPACTTGRTWYLHRQLRVRFFWSVSPSTKRFCSFDFAAPKIATRAKKRRNNRWIKWQRNRRSS
ncbi:hypothetical protein KM043_006368 [Ampulex compressa]|nr:hypothetical protein KM043_006368 [Ampulex compressa]